MFEPTDLEMEEPGVVEADLQLGLIKGPSASRFVVPDIEVDVGISKNVELELDWTYAIEGQDSAGFSLDHAAPDNLWIATKLGILDYRCEECRSSWAMGAQLGPKAPMARGVHGVGFEALFIVDRKIRRTQIALNLGGLVDPGEQDTSSRPRGLEAGLDLSVDLDETGRFSVLGEVGGVRYDAAHSDQFHGTLGGQWAASEAFRLNVVGLKGLRATDDQWGALFGIAYKGSVF